MNKSTSAKILVLVIAIVIVSIIALVVWILIKKEGYDTGFPHEMVCNYYNKRYDTECKKNNPNRDKQICSELKYFMDKNKCAGLVTNKRRVVDLCSDRQKLKDNMASIDYLINKYLVQMDGKTLNFDIGNMTDKDLSLFHKLIDNQIFHVLK